MEQYKMKTVAIIDADIIAFKAASSAQASVEWGESLTTVAVNEEGARQYAEDQIETIRTAVRATEVLLCFSQPFNFRYGILPSYKSNRKDSVKPLALKDVVQHLRSLYPSEGVPSLEGDDLLGIYMTDPTHYEGYKKVMVSEDKDLKGIPGLLFNPAKDSFPKRNTYEFARRFHMYQTLIGDPVDGYKGCPAMGPVKAKKLLADTPVVCLWDMVVAQYERKGLTEEHALQQARVAKILESHLFNKTNNEAILWTPNLLIQ
jgi:5'-3' exonuclease